MLKNENNWEVGVIETVFSKAILSTTPKHTQLKHERGMEEIEGYGWN